MKLGIQQLAQELMTKAVNLADEANMLDHGLDDMDDIDGMYTLAAQIKRCADVLEDRIAAFKLFKEDAINQEQAGYETNSNLEY